MRVEVRSGKSNVYEITFLLISLLIGAKGLIIGAPDNSVIVTLGSWGAYAFYLVTFVASSGALLGLWLPSQCRFGLRFERAGLIALSGAWIGYGLAVIAAAGETGFSVASILIGFGLANLCRVLQIRNDVRQSRGLTALMSSSRGDHE